MSRPMDIGRPGRGPGINLVKSNEKLKNPKETIFRLLKYIGNKANYLIFIFVFCTITTLVSIIGTKLNGNIVDNYIALGNISGLFRMCIVLIVMYVSATLSTFVQNRLMVKIAQETSADIRKDLYSKEYYKSKTYEEVGDSRVVIKRGLVEVLSKMLLLDK